MSTSKLITTVSFAFLFMIFSIQTRGQGMGGPGGNHQGGPGTYIGHHGFEIEHNLVLPQIAVGQDVTTTLALASHASPSLMSWLDEGDLQVTGTLHFFQQDGTPMLIRINGGAASPDFSFQLTPGQLLTLDLTAEGPNTPGWALITVDDEEEEEIEWGMRDNHSVYRGERLMATVFYTLTGEQGELLSRVGVVPSIYERDLFLNSILVVRCDSQVNTGLAVVNTASESTTLQVHLKNASGETVAEAPLTLAAGQQVALFIDQLFAGAVPTDFSGYLEITSTDNGVVVMGLLMTQGILTSVPTHHFGRWQQGNVPLP